MGLFTMPSLGADMEAGTLVEWLVEPGDTVKRGDVVAVVETQKGAIEIECFQEGIVQALKADPGAELPVGAPLALIRAPGETSSDNDALPNDARQPALATATAVAPPAAGPSLWPGPAEAPAVSPVGLRTGDQPASPAARLRARQLGLDLAAMTGSGPGAPYSSRMSSGSRRQGSPRRHPNPGWSRCARPSPPQ